MEEECEVGQCGDAVRIIDVVDRVQQVERHVAAMPSFS
jgi:hypothetical protein